MLSHTCTRTFSCRWFRNCRSLKTVDGTCSYSIYASFHVVSLVSNGTRVAGTLTFHQIIFIVLYFPALPFKVYEIWLLHEKELDLEAAYTKLPVIEANLKMWTPWIIFWDYYFLTLRPQGSLKKTRSFKKKCFIRFFSGQMSTTLELEKCIYVQFYSSYQNIQHCPML